MKHYHLLPLLIILSVFEAAFAQIKIGDGSGLPNPSAVLELESTNKGFLPPRMSSRQRDFIPSPSNGMVIFNTSMNCLQLFSAGSWTCLGSSSPAVFPPRLPFDELVALPSPQVGDQAYDLTFLCLRSFNGSKWVCSSKPPGDPSPDATAWGAGGTGGDSGDGVAVDGSGNVYVTGFFSGSATFGSTTINSAGGPDIFVAKYNTSGTVLWARSAGGTGFDYGHGIAVDGSGNVFVTGYFSGSATFGSTTINSAGAFDIFVAKYTSSGAVLWAQRAGGIGNDFGMGIAVDGSGNVFVTGYFPGSATFGSATINSAGFTDIFVAKYNSSGAVLWAQRAGGTSNDQGQGIAVDGSGNVYVTGEFSGSATFGSTTINSAGGPDIFVAKYNNSGAVLWAQRAGGTSNDQGQGIAVDGSGNVYVTGEFSGSATFGSTTFNSAGDRDIFVARFIE